MNPGKEGVISWTQAPGLRLLRWYLELGMPSATAGLGVKGKCVTADNMGTPPPTKGRESDPQPTRPNNNDNIHVFPSLNTLLLMTS